MSYFGNDWWAPDFLLKNYAAMEKEEPLSWGRAATQAAPGITGAATGGGSDASRIGGGVGTALMAIPTPYTQIAGAVLSTLSGIFGAHGEAERRRKAEEKRRALEMASWASENFNRAGWGGY